MTEVVETLVEKLVELERQVAAERGDFSLFALCLREGAIGKWDLVVTAPWLEGDDGEGLRYLARLLQSRLSPKELLSLSGVIVLSESDPFPVALKRLGKTEHSSRFSREMEVAGVPLEKVVLITNR